MPEGYEVMLFIAAVFPAVFLFAFGACMGSLANVLVYRMPRGLNVVTPPSACPHCHTRLTWRENIPILGWLLLRGRCRFCKSPISAEYPLVEAFTALLFGGLYLLWFVAPPSATLVGLPIGTLRPDWAMEAVLGIKYGWPIFALTLLLLFSLIVMTLIDAKTYTIPLSLTWICAGAALVVHPAAAAYVNAVRGGLFVLPGDWTWVIPTPPTTSSFELEVGGRAVQVFTQGWWWIGASIGAAVGLAGSLLLLRTGLIRRSFLDYEAWETEQLAKQAAEAQSALAAAPTAADPTGEQPASQPRAVVDDPTQLWIAYPHARREMIKELAFLAPVVLLALLGGYLLDQWQCPVLTAEWAAKHPAGVGLLGASYEAVPPLWLLALCGSLMGYFIGGGIVWFFRIFGSLAFGKEAMGLGDVHLMAGVGAIVGWIDAGLAFLLAAFVGMAWTIIAAVAGGGMKRTMPYGPYLAIATVLVMIFKPLIEKALSALWHMDVNLPG